MKIAYAITIQKSQGLTLEMIVIDLCNCKFAAGLTDVVLSRVKKLVDLVFIVYPDKKRFDRIGMSKVSKLRIKFLKSLRLKALGKITLHIFNNYYIHLNELFYENIFFILQN